MLSNGGLSYFWNYLPFKYIVDSVVKNGKTGLLQKILVLASFLEISHNSCLDLAQTGKVILTCAKLYLLHFVLIQISTYLLGNNFYNSKKNSSLKFSNIYSCKHTLIKTEQE
jgi:hypothetical protein